LSPPRPELVAADLEAVARLLPRVLREYAIAHGYALSPSRTWDGAGRRALQDIRPVEDVALNDRSAEHRRDVTRAAHKIDWARKELSNALVILEKVTDERRSHVRQAPYDKQNALIPKAAFEEAVEADRRRRERVEGIGEG